MLLYDGGTTPLEICEHSTTPQLHSMEDFTAGLHGAAALVTIELGTFGYLQKHARLVVTPLEVPAPASSECKLRGSWVECLLSNSRREQSCFCWIRLSWAILGDCSLWTSAAGSEQVSDAWRNRRKATSFEYCLERGWQNWISSLCDDIEQKRGDEGCIKLHVDGWVTSVEGLFEKWGQGKDSRRFGALGCGWKVQWVWV